MRTIDQVLDTARAVQKVPSDYKLALTLGIGGTSLSNYRNGRSFPDEKTCAKLADAMGEKPDLLIVEMMAQRAKDTETQALWANIAKRLQMGFANCSLLLAIAIISGVLYSPAVRAAADTVFSTDGSLYIMYS